MRADRLLAVLLVLKSRGRTTAQVLADELEVSVRTIYRDLEALSTAGFPVYAERGPGGGCQLLDGYRLELGDLNRSETGALVQLSADSLAADLGFGDALLMARRKLLAGGPRLPDGTAGRIARKVHLDPVGWFRQPEHSPLLPAIFEALAHERRVRIRYRHGDGRPRTHTLDPLGLVAKAGIWYLVGRDANQPRVFRVARIAKVITLDEGRATQADFDLAEFWTRWTADFERSLRRIDVRLRVSAEDLPILELKLGTVRTTERHLGPDMITYWAEVAVAFESLEAAESQLLSLGTRIEVIAPPALRNRLAHTTAALAAIYSKPVPALSRSALA